MGGGSPWVGFPVENEVNAHTLSKLPLENYPLGFYLKTSSTARTCGDRDV